MKHRTLALAVKKIIWAELALSAVFTVSAFAQSQAANSATAPVAADIGSTPASSIMLASAAAPAGDTKSTGQQDNKVVQIKRFEVTGSLIRSADKTGFNQVQTMSQKDIQNSGSTAVADFLRSSSSNSASTYSESTVQSQSPGGAGIALRGLSEKYTLVLVDGQRVAPYAFASGGTDTFFDLDALPVNVIDRIERLDQHGKIRRLGLVYFLWTFGKFGVQQLSESDQRSGGAELSGGCDAEYV